MKTGFDKDRYLDTQSEQIMKRIDMFGGKLYMEVGGKIFDDLHASRVLPGFEPDSKIRMLMQMTGDVDTIVVINSNDIERNKVRGDFGITYDLELLRMVNMFEKRGIPLAGVVLTMYDSQPSAKAFLDRLSSSGIKTYKNHMIPGYPSDTEMILSADGFGRNDHVKTERKLTIVTAPGPGSGKLATCLSQIYLDNLEGVKSGYAKFETFPIWNLPLRHPVNMAYEAATADLGDVNMIDPFHMDAYGKAAVNYNRDIEAFPIMNTILEKILGESPYRSPTDMGVNMAGYCITDDVVVSYASKMEIVRRYYRGLCDNRKGMLSDDVVRRLENIMHNACVKPDLRRIIPAVMSNANDSEIPVAGLELDDGRIVIARESESLTAPSAMILDALKTIAGMDPNILLMSSDVVAPIQKIKNETIGRTDIRMDINEMLIALSVLAERNNMAAETVSHLHELRGCEVHSSVMASPSDMDMMKGLGLNVTCEPNYRKTGLPRFTNDNSRTIPLYRKI